MITPPPVEPEAAPWHSHLFGDVVTGLLARVGTPDGRPIILAVDGRQGGGKTTVAERLANHVPGSIVVHTDDVAWWESFFGWDHLMAGGILEPLRRGEDIDYRPPAWDTRGRGGSIVVPASATLVVVEGVGASRRSLSPLLDGAIWAQSDFDDANRRGIAREGGSQQATDFWWEWDREEQPFLADDRPWERAALIVCGTPHMSGVSYDPALEIIVGRSLQP